jgi:peptidoglycan-associated lipoprotein
MGAVHFDFDESRIRLDARDALTANAQCIKDNGQAVVVEGHCDERGDEEYNLALGEQRALAAIRYLKNLGTDGSKLRPFSRGFTVPLCMESAEGCWSRNRRAEFQFE